MRRFQGGRRSGPPGRLRCTSAQPAPATEAHMPCEISAALLCISCARACAGSRSFTRKAQQNVMAHGHG